jgi:hypothetical protein
MPIGAIAGGLASGLAGDLLGGGDSGGAEPIPFTPTTVTGPFGVTNATPALPGIAAQVQTTLSPELQAIQNLLLGQATGAFATPTTVSPYLTGAGTSASQAAQGAFGALNTFDPNQATAEQYALMMQLLGPQQQQDALALEERLYQQGRLGSTGGSLEQQALSQAQNLANVQAYLDSQTAAQQAQQNLASLGSTTGAFGAGMAQLPLTLQGQQLGLGTSALGAALAPAEMAMQQAQLASMVQPMGYTATSPSTSSQLGSGLISGGADLLSSGISGLFNE